MIKKNNLEKFRQYKLKDANQVKGGVRSNYSGPGGTGGVGFIDWGEVDVRTNGLRFSHFHLAASTNSTSTEP